MVQPDWQGFGIRLGRAIDRWPGGGQRAFADALAAYAKRRGIAIPKSYRTLVNYLNGDTQPGEAWVDVAAAVLGNTTAEELITGLSHDGATGRPDDWAGIALQGPATPRALALMDLVMNAYLDLPWEARLIVHGFAGFYFGNDTEGWDDRAARRADVDDMVRTYFGPLRVPAAAKMDTASIMALTASLAAAAYLQFDPSSVPARGIDPADALADLRRRQPPSDIDFADLARRAGKVPPIVDAPPSRHTTHKDEGSGS
jgi:hypothetical protein